MFFFRPHLHTDNVGRLFAIVCLGRRNHMGMWVSPAYCSPAWGRDGEPTHGMYGIMITVDQRSAICTVTDLGCAGMDNRDTITEQLILWRYNNFRGTIGLLAVHNGLTADTTVYYSVFVLIGIGYILVH